MGERLLKDSATLVRKETKKKKKKTYPDCVPANGVAGNGAGGCGG